MFVLRVLCAALAYIGFGLGALLVALSLVFAWAWGGSRLVRRRRCQRWAGGGFRLFHAYMTFVGLIRYCPTLKMPERAGPRVIVANHPTLVDVTALLSAYPEACCVVKSAYYDNPLFFIIMKFCGHIRADRSRKDNGAQVIELAADRLTEGSDVLLFPEGTRSPTDEVGLFHAGAFAVAVHGEVPVAPVSIFCARPVLKRGAPWYLIPPEPVTLQLSSLGHMVPDPGEQISHFKDRVRARIVESLSPPAP